MTRLAILVAVGSMAVAIAGDARQERTQPLPSFRSGVDVIQIEATVLDGAGRPVRGMRAADFTLFEDGKVQAIVAFSAVDVPDRVATARRDVRFTVR